MRSIEVKTTQNVTIDYELAGAGLRIVSFLLDYFIIGAFITLSNLIITLIFIGANSEDLVFMFLIPVVIIACFYSLIFEIALKGQTLGKKVLGIRVIKVDGNELTFRDYFTRWSLRFVDIYLSLGTLAILTINGSVLGQRVGDMAAGTTVVRIRNSQGFTLAQILGLHTKESYNPVYPGVRNLKEEDVLLIKNTLNRNNRYANSYYQAATSELFEKVVPFLQLEIESTQVSHQQKVSILKQVVNDYIVITR